MDSLTADELREARGLLASLLGKSEKALQKLAPGSWRHAMLGDNVRALRTALALMGGGAATGVPTGADLRALASMAGRSGAARAKSSPGTSQHSLLRNRLKALRVAEAVIRARLPNPDAEPGATEDGGGM